NKRMKGANAWLLMCSIMIASLGLDLNSPAVIIGAMLISPLMSPILGVGLGVGINDRETLYVSLQHFVIAIGIALFTSTFYFFFTPFGDTTDEILARTSPNTLDALVAFFGGIAGIISGSRIDKSNAIPGVAIATALMPPLCVTGYGIANGEWAFMFNSFYLFFLNATLVALATFLIVRFLRFPMKQYETVRDNRKMNLIIFIFSLVVTLPSLYILNQVWQDFRFKKNTELFLKEYCGKNFKYIDSWETAQLDSFNIIGVKIYGSGSEHFNIEKMEASLPEYGIKNTKIDLIPTSEVDLAKEFAKYNKLESEISGFKNIAEQLNVAREARSQNEIIIDNLQAKIDSIGADTIPFKKISDELKAAFPNVDQVAFAKARESNFKSVKDMPILLLNWQKGTSLSTIQKEEPRVTDFVKVRIGLDTLKVIQY
ncbi:MAG: putative hydrophobic protein (TIGR00271 family), partial [Saprospiraceae bacterium]